MEDLHGAFEVAAGKVVPDILQHVAIAFVAIGVDHSVDLDEVTLESLQGGEEEVLVRSQSLRGYPDLIFGLEESLLQEDEGALEISAAHLVSQVRFELPAAWQLLVRLLDRRELRL